MDIILTEIEARILGCLIEKEHATPEYYPMTINALTNACNQKSSRNPIMSLSIGQVEEVISEMRTKSIVYLKRESGSRVGKYRHNLEVFLPNLRLEEVALLCVLLLRGRQTAGELRARTERIYLFGSTVEVDQTIENLLDWHGKKLVKKIPSGIDKKTHTYVQQLTGEFDVDQIEKNVYGQYDDANVSNTFNNDDKIESLENKISILENDYQKLSKEIESIKSELGINLNATV